MCPSVCTQLVVLSSAYCSCPKVVVVVTLQHCHPRKIIRAILGKTQFNASLLHWNRAVTSSACYRCGTKEDFKHACFLCPEALSLYTSIHQTLGFTPNLTITNMLLGPQRPCYIGDQKMRNEKLDIIKSIKTLGHILKSRSSNMPLSSPSLGQMSVIKYKIPKYKIVLDNILARLKSVHSKLALFLTGRRKTHLCQITAMGFFWKSMLAVDSNAWEQFSSNSHF